MKKGIVRAVDVVLICFAAILIFGGTGVYIFANQDVSLPAPQVQAEAKPGLIITGEVVKNTETDVPTDQETPSAPTANSANTAGTSGSSRVAGGGSGGGGGGGGSGTSGTATNNQPSEPTTTVAVLVSGATDLSGVQLDITYNTALTLVSMSEGTFLDNGNPNAAALLSTAETVPGAVRGVVVLRLDPNGVTGSGTLVTLTFRGTGSPNVQATGILSNSNAQPISAALSTRVQ